MWFVGFGVLVALELLFPNPILLIIVLFAGLRALPPLAGSANRARSQQAAYYRVSPRHRLLVGAVYIGLIVLLVLGMEHSHILQHRPAQLPLALGAGRRASAPRFADGPFHVALGLAVADRLALVVEVLAAGQRDLDLGVRAGEVDPRRHQRQPALVDADREPVELAAVQQQLARALRVVVLARGRPVGRDVDGVQPQLAVRAAPRSRPSAAPRSCAAP